MADVGHIAEFGCRAGAIKYLVLEGFETNAGGGVTLAPSIPTLGFGLNANTNGRLALLGWVANPGGGGSGAFYIFGESVVR